MHPIVLGSLISAGAGLLGKLFGGGGDDIFKGQPIQYQPMLSPQEQALRNAIAQRMMSYLSMSAPPVSPGAYDAMNILYNTFLGRPYPSMPQTPTGGFFGGMMPRQPMNWTGLGWSPQVFQNLMNQTRINPMMLRGGGGALPRGDFPMKRGLAF